MSEVINDWKEIEEEKRNKCAQDLLSMYGPFSVIIYSRIKKSELFQIPDANNFIRSFIEFYLKNIHNIKKSEEYSKNIKTLISFFPSGKKFIRLLRFHNHNAKERILFKLAIDISENYFKSMERPIFSKLQKRIFPLAVRFYERMTDEALTDINLMIRAKSKKSK